MNTESTTATPTPEIPERLLDSDAVKVVRKLRRAGHEAYLVGGCVRDLLLGIRPKDFDVATSAHPNQVRDTFRNSRLIGRRFRLAHVFYGGGKIVEVSTFRANPLDELADLPQDLLIRHDNVFGNAEEDARRRDFTVNGLFYDPDAGKVIDYVGGKADLAARLMHTIGKPDVRMREDPVRILRAIRFAAKCGFNLETNTATAMKAHAAEIPRCAPPRVLEEVLKLMRSGASRRCVELLRQVGALQVLLSPVAEYLESHGPDALQRYLRALDALDAHVRVGEIPSDAVLLATLLAPLPREAEARNPTARGAQQQKQEPQQDADEALEKELDALEESSEEEDEEEPPALAPDADPAHAPLPEAALRAEAELHDERLGGVPTGSAGGPVEPWSLPKGVVPPEVVLTELVRTARLPRRIAERARMILLAQPILSGERRRRRSSPQSFVRQTYFPEALAVFELSVAASGKGEEHLARWQSTFAGADLSQIHGEEREEKDGRPRRRRRRRGGRGGGTHRH